MSTKLYFNIKTIDWNNNTWASPGDFDLYTFGITPQMMDTTILGTSAASLLSPNCDSMAAPVKMCMYRGVSRRLSPQTINGDFDVVIATNHTLDSDDCYTKVDVYVMDEDTGGGSPFNAGYLLQHDERPSGSTPGTEWPVGWSTRGLVSPATLTPFVVPSDGRNYRLVVEVGVVTIRAGFSNIFARIQQGCRDSQWVKQSDMTTGYGPSSTAPTGAPHCIFSDDITFGSFQYSVSNHEPEDAVDVGNQPVALTITNVSTVAPNPPAIDRWWKYSESADKFLGVLSCSAGSPGSDTNTLTIFSELDTSLDGPPLLSMASSVKRMLAVPMGVDRNLLFRINLGSLVETILRVENAPTTVVEAGDLLVLSDNHSENFYDDSKPGGVMPSVFIAPDGVIKYVTGLLLGTEIAVSLGSGRWGAADQYITNKLIIFDKAPNQLNELFRVPCDGEITTMGTDFISFFVVTNDPDISQSIVFKVSANGVTDPTSWEVPVVNAGNRIFSCGVSRNGGVLYYRNNASMNDISRFDLANNDTMTPFTIAAAGAVCDIIVLNDSTIVAACESADTTLNTHFVIHLSAAGDILHTYLVPLSVDGGGNLHHLVHSAEDSDTQVWIWLQPDAVDTGGNSKNRFQLIDLELGTIITQFDGERSGTVVPYDASCDPTTKFGSPGSCPLMIMMEPVDAPTTPDTTGIYYIDKIPIPGERRDKYYNDVEKKIPNPTIRTALFGE